MTKPSIEVKFKVPAHKLRALSDFLDKLLSDKPDRTKPPFTDDYRNKDEDIQLKDQGQLREKTEAEKRIDLGKASTGELIPWDKRIHRSNKLKTLNGHWMIKPKIDRQKLLPDIERELIESMGEISNPEKDGKILKFTDLIPLVRAGQSSGDIDDKMITDACQKLGIEQFGELVMETDLIPKMAKLLNIDS